MLGILYRFAELMGKFIDLLGRWGRLLVDGVDGESIDQSDRWGRGGRDSLGGRIGCGGLFHGLARF